MAAVAGIVVPSIKSKLSTSSSSSKQPTILNYRPAIILPGLGNNSSDYEKLQVTLKQVYGVPSVVPKVSRLDWLRNAAGLIDPNYWRGTLRPRPVLDWYLERTHEAVSQAMLLAQEADGGSGRVSLIGHSAGGWLARLYMEEFGTSSISLLLTLGSPLSPPPKDSPGVIDQTRGLLDYVERNCAPAVFTPELRYVCVAGRYIQGARFFVNSNGDSSNSIEIRTGSDLQQSMSGDSEDSNKTTSIATETTTRSRIVGQGYKQVCGKADVWGDGVVPEVSAHLEGAMNITLDGVYHSPVGSDDTRNPWYGSPAVVEKWIHHLLT